MEAAGEGFVKEGDQIASILADFPGNVLHKFSFGLPSGGGEDSGRGAHGLSVEFCGIDESSEGDSCFFDSTCCVWRLARSACRAFRVGSQFDGILYAFASHAVVFEFAVESREVEVGIEEFGIESDCFCATR
jgi:hypothetical protein